MRNSIAVQLVAVVTCAVLLFGSAQLIPPINDVRGKLNMVASEEELENAPPEYAFWIQAFGSFRSLLTSIAFIRAEEYKQQGRFYDALELAQLICDLQPRFPAVWEYHAWNMSWNISVTTHTPEERWHWVYNGVRLLRDRGVPMNPRAVNLYKQIAWTFNNKMGAELDDYHNVYKAEWAWRMHLLLGPPPNPLVGLAPDEVVEEIGFDLQSDPLREAARIQGALIREKNLEKGFDLSNVRPPDDGLEITSSEDPNAPIDPLDPAVITKAAALEKMQAIADAPRTLAALYAAHPECKAMVGRLRELGVRISDESLSEDEYWSENGLAFTFFQPYRELSDPSMIVRLRADEDGGGLSPRLTRFDEIVGVREQRPAGQALLRYLQRKVLTEVYRNDPDHMVWMVRRFGAMDWRVVDAQSLYWATQALIRSKGTKHEFGNDKVNTMRLVLFSLQGLARRNKVFFEPNPEYIPRSYLNFAHDPLFIESMHDAYVSYAPYFDAHAIGGEGAGEMFRAGHVNFLSEGIRFLYFAGREEAARKYYNYLRDTYTYNAIGELNEQYLVSLDEYARDTLLQNIELERDARGAIYGLLFQGFTRLGEGDAVAFANYVRTANDVYTEYMTQRGSQEIISERMRLPATFRQTYEDAFGYFMASPLTGHVLTKARVWAVAPVDLQQAVYDYCLPYFTEYCRYMGFELARSFPEPPNMDEYRESNPRREAPWGTGTDVEEALPPAPLQ